MSIPNPNIMPAKKLAQKIKSGEFTLDDLIDNGISQKQLEDVKHFLELLGVQTAEQTAWTNAVSTNTFQAYNDFIQHFPSSSHIQEANSKLSELKKKEMKSDFENACMARTIEAYTAFIEKYPELTDMKQKAEEEITNLKREKIQSDFNHVMMDAGVTVAEMEAFCSDYAGTPEAESVRQKITQLLNEKEDLDWRDCRTADDYKAFRAKYPHSSKINLIETKLKEIEILLQHQDDEAWEQVKILNTLAAVSDYLSNESYIRHRIDAEKKKRELEDAAALEPKIMAEINEVLMAPYPYKDVIDYLELCAKYPQKTDYIKRWMLSDMKRTPHRYQRDEMYVLLNDVNMNDSRWRGTSIIDLAEPLKGKALFTPMEIINERILDYERVQWIKDKPEKRFDDTNDITPKETCFEMEKNTTDVYFFGVPGSGKTSVLSGLCSVSTMPDKSTFSFHNQGKHKGYGYAVSLKQKITDHVFPARTRVFTFEDSLAPVDKGIGVTLGSSSDSFGTSPDIGSTWSQDSASSTMMTGSSTNTDQDLFIQIIDSEICNPDGSKHKLNIIEMPGEATLRFAAARSNDMSMLGDGAKKLFDNENNKLIFFVIDPNDKKAYEVLLNGVPVRITQADALHCVARFLSSKVSDMSIKNLKAVQVLLAKSDMLSLKEGQSMNECLDNLMNNSSYSGLMNQLNQICSAKNSDINKHCGHEVKLFTFSLGQILPGDMLNYNPADSQKIIRVIAANAISVGSKTLWDSIIEFMNK